MAEWAHMARSINSLRRSGPHDFGQLPCNEPQRQVRQLSPQELGGASDLAIGREWRSFITPGKELEARLWNIANQDVPAFRAHCLPAAFSVPVFDKAPRRGVVSACQYGSPDIARGSYKVPEY